jgi:hypothetical protein
MLGAIYFVSLYLNQIGADTVIKPVLLVEAKKIPFEPMLRAGS